MKLVKFCIVGFSLLGVSHLASAQSATYQESLIKYLNEAAARESRDAKGAADFRMIARRAAELKSPYERLGVHLLPTSWQTPLTKRTSEKQELAKHHLLDLERDIRNFPESVFKENSDRIAHAQVLLFHARHEMSEGWFGRSDAYQYVTEAYYLLHDLVEGGRMSYSASPPNAKAGECWVPVYTPPAFSERKALVETKAARQQLVPVDPTWVKVPEVRMVREGSFRYTIKPAAFSNKVSQVILSQPNQQWTRLCATTNRLGEVSDVWCLVQTGAKYTNVVATIEAKPDEAIRVEIPPVYATNWVEKVDQSPNLNRIDIPAEVQEVRTQEQVSSDKWAWLQIICNPSSELVTAVQNALSKRGNFYRGAVDGNASKDVQNALDDFQRANGLTPGGIYSYETLESLGIDPNLINANRIGER